MNCYAVLCGSAPENYRQKKLVYMHDFLTSEKGGSVPESNIIIFPNGANELFLESVLNGIFDDAAAEEKSDVLLYFCAESESDLKIELSDCERAGVEAVRLGKNEIRKDVIAYYSEKLARMLDVKCRVIYEADNQLISEEELGYESVSGGGVLC